MVQVTIEYMIMIPLLIMQIFLLPYAAGLIMNNWVTSRQTLELQDAASHLGSSMQQIYFSLNHDTITAGTVTDKLEIPPLIEGIAYTGNGTLVNATNSGVKVLDLTLKFNGTIISTTTPVTLGQNVAWQNSNFTSNSPTACIIATKYANGTIQFSFGR